ncbi:sugar transferase [Micromonospora sp. STR1s_5]|nr:sugar transferase [Micromonospora sp. STR1s_5]
MTSDELAEVDYRPLGGVPKRSFDLAFGVTALVFLGVLMAVIALMILLADGRPVLFRHRRIGRGGRRFDCLKFRTMVVDGERVLTDALSQDSKLSDEWLTTRKLKRDPRITSVGNFLRRSSLDELPQLFNIIKGDMSVVGPRPIVREEVSNYGECINYYYRTRPGLTGAWQVSGRNDLSYETRVRLDREYVQSWSLTKDVVIVGKTLPAVLLAKGVY